MAMFFPSYYGAYYWYKHHSQQQNQQEPRITSDANKYQISLNLSQFKLSEINLKIIGGHSICIEAHREVQEIEGSGKHGFEVPLFKHNYILPDDIDPNDIHAEMSSNGVLKLTGPRRRCHGGNETQALKLEKENERPESSIRLLSIDLGKN